MWTELNIFRNIENEYHHHRKDNKVLFIIISSISRLQEKFISSCSEWRTGNFGADTAVSPTVLFYKEYLKIVSPEGTECWWAEEKYETRNNKMTSILGIIANKQYQWTFIAKETLSWDIVKHSFLCKKEKQFYLK